MPRTAFDLAIERRPSAFGTVSLPINETRRLDPGRQQWTIAMINSASLQHAHDHLHERPNAGQAADTSVLWRKKHAQQFDEADLAAVRGTLAKAVLMNEPKWAEARVGNAADAIALAVAEWPITVLTSRLDLIMTALLLAAMTDSAAAAVVLAHVVRQLPGGTKHHKRIAASWLARNLRAALAKRARRPSAPTRLLLKSACVDVGARRL